MRTALRMLLMGAEAAAAAAPVYEAEASALFARFSSQPDATRKGHINTLILALKAAGVWAKLDCYYIMAAHDAQAGQRNWVQDLYNLTPIASPTFTADRGYTGNGTTSYLATGFVPSTAAGHFALNDGAFGVWSLTDSSGSFTDIGCRDTSTTAMTNLIARNAGDLATYRISQGNSAQTGSVTNSIGSFTVRRSASNAKALFRNGVSVTTAATVSTTLTAVEFFLGALNTGGVASQFSTRQYAQGYIASSLSDGELTAKYTAELAYMQAVGAA